MSKNKWEKPKPQAGCKHRWALADQSSVPSCEFCSGVIMYGHVDYTRAHLEAMMRSNRGSRIVKSSGGSRDGEEPRL